MEHWYRVSHFGTEIVQYEVSKVTERTITFLQKYYNGVPEERRQNRTGAYASWFPCREDAVAFLRDRLTRSIKYHEGQIEAEKKKLERLA